MAVYSRPLPSSQEVARAVTRAIRDRHVHILTRGQAAYLKRRAAGVVYTTGDDEK